MGIYNILIFLSVVFSVVKCDSELECIPKRHLWRPYFGGTIVDALKVPDKCGRVSYIARVVVHWKDGKTRLVPAHFECYAVEFAWSQPPVKRYKKFVEVLATCFPHYYTWINCKNLDHYEELKQTTCFVIGGAAPPGDNFTAIYHIGRIGVGDNRYVIGRVSQLDGFEGVAHGKCYQATTNFEILTYITLVA